MIEHPAKFSESIMKVIAQVLVTDLGVGGNVLDPFAGTGRIHQLRPHFTTTGIEIEKEWAAMSPHTLLGTALELPFSDGKFDAICTSPTYGNRMADHHNAKDSSKRITYRHKLGHPLHPDNSGQMQWGVVYRQFHRQAWLEAIRVLRPGGLFLLNISDHIRKGVVQEVSRWHSELLIELGLMFLKRIDILTPRMRFGSNAHLRTGTEYAIVFSKPNLTGECEHEQEFV